MAELEGLFSAYIKDFVEIQYVLEEKIKMKNFLRISYYDGLYYVTTNAIFLTYSQLDLKSTLLDLIYLRPNLDLLAVEPRLKYEIIRSECVVMQIDGEFRIESEIRFFAISEKDISKFVENLDLLSQNNLSLTHLRKILANKNTEKSICFNNTDTSEDEQNIKKYTLQLVMNQSNIILIQKEENSTMKSSNSNFFAKTDIISYFNFLKIAEIFITSENAEFQCDVSHIKLRNVLARIRNRKKEKKDEYAALNKRITINEEYTCGQEIIFEETKFIKSSEKM